MSAADIETLALAASRWLFQWRSDGCWRQLNREQYDDERNGVHTPAEDDWVRWTGARDSLQAGGEGPWDGTPTWWFVYGELPAGERPRVQLADGTEPQVLTVGRVWACEWVSAAQPATVHLDGTQAQLLFRRPDYLQ
jgi:hypothetical protein